MTRTRPIVRTMVFAQVVLACAGAVAASAGGVIETEGVATVEAVPDYAVFWLQKVCIAATMTEAVRAAEEYGVVLQEDIKARKLPDPTIEVSEIAVQSAAQPLAKFGVKLTFAAGGFAQKGGLAAFAALCDTLVGIAETQECTLEGPVYEVAARDGMEQNAIARAIEQALPPAVGAANIMKTRIDSIESVEVLNVAWNKELDSRAPQPQVRRATCTARVRVRYRFGTLFAQ